MFRQDGQVINIKSPKVHASVQANLFTVSGAVKECAVNDLMPGILTQMGHDALQGLNKLAQSYQQNGIDASTKDSAKPAEPEIDFEEVSQLD